MSDISRRDVREYYWTPITIEELGIRYSYRARLGDSSRIGIYFETDLLLYREAKVYIQIQDPTHRLFSEERSSFLVEIIWRKRLSENLFHYGYGAKMTLEHAEKKFLANLEVERKELGKIQENFLQNPHILNLKINITKVQPEI